MQQEGEGGGATPRARPHRAHDHYATVNQRYLDAMRQDDSQPGFLQDKHLCDLDAFTPGETSKPERRYSKELLDPVVPVVARMYESMNRCTTATDAESINSFISDASSSKYKSGNHYVDMARTYKDAQRAHDVDVYNRALQDNSNRIQNGQRKEKMIRRHTTEYRGPPQLALPALKNDSSDSNAERSPVAGQNSQANYPYLMLAEQRNAKKKNSITSSTSEDNSDIIAAAIKLRMQGKEWRENKAPKRVDSLTVDRRSMAKKSNSKSGKIKRRGSFNIDPAGEFHLSLDVNKEKDISCSVRSSNAAKSPLMDARKTPLQISAEDMVQIANCGARNKNGSLCHFISANDEAYLSISQVLLNQSSESEKMPMEGESSTRRQYSTVERNSKKKKSTHSLAFESSDETLCAQQQKPRKESKYGETSNERRLRQHQRTFEIEKPFKIKIEPQGRKLLHSKSENHSTRHKTGVPGYYLLEDESGCSVPVRITPAPEPTQRKESLKYQSPSLEVLDKRSTTQLVVDISNLKDKEACKCAMSNHSLAKADPFRETSDFSSDTDPGNHVFRRLGTSSREELTTSGGDVEESFDF